MKWLNLLIIALVFGGSAFGQAKNQKMKKEENYKVQKSEDEWKADLSPAEFYVLRQAGTERPYTGEYNMHFDDGVYKCAACDAPLFESDSKFETHCGWPGFDKAISKDAVVEKLDKSAGMIRTEILCGNCGGHLGHLFNDGPTETGMRYCINSVSLDFDKEK